MGKISDFNLQYYINAFGTKKFIETGSGTGSGIEYAMRFPFDSIDSCEIDVEQAAKLSKRYEFDKRVKVWPKESSAFLTEILSNSGTSFPIVFFLDAHFPGADLGKAKFDAEPDLDIRLPLQRELEIIRMFRPEDNDVIIIDDLRIYENGPFSGGNMADYGVEHCANYIGLDFVSKIFQDTHSFTKFYNDSGYLLLEPKKNK